MNRCKNDKADETRMIRFIDPNYRELFQIPDGAYVEVKYPNSTVIVACGCMDDYHLRFGSEVYHICELAERLERCQATCAPEPEITEDECAWKLGNKGYLYVQVSEVVCSFSVASCDCFFNSSSTFGFFRVGWRPGRYGRHHE